MSTSPVLSRSVPITVISQLGRWRLARAAAHADHAEQLLAQARAVPVEAHGCRRWVRGLQGVHP
jgi:hypothetical protein